MKCNIMDGGSHHTNAIHALNCYYGKVFYPKHLRIVWQVLINGRPTFIKSADHSDIIINDIIMNDIFCRLKTNHLKGRNSMAFLSS